MTTKSTAFLVLLTLLAMCGQVLAAPFLVCAHEHYSSIQVDGMGEHEGCNTLQQKSGNVENESHSHHGHAHPSSDDIPGTFDHQDCDGWCQSCVGVGTATVSSSTSLSYQLKASPEVVFSLPLPNTSLELPYKPPIAV